MKKEEEKTVKEIAVEKEAKEVVNSGDLRIDKSEHLNKNTGKKQDKAEKNVVNKDERFKTIYLKYQQRIYWYILKKVSQGDQAEDLVADVFLKLYENWDSVVDRDEKGVVAWLYTVARNASIDFLRKLQNRQKKSSEVEDIETVAGVFKSIVDDVMKDEQWNNVSVAMSILTEEERDIIRLRFEEDLTFIDIAEAIGTTEGACKMTFYRSIKKLKKELNKIYEKKSDEAIKSNNINKQDGEKEKATKKEEAQI